MLDKYFQNQKKLSTSSVDEHSYLVRTRGYSVIPNFYDSDLCQSLKTELQSAIDRYSVTEGSQRSKLDQYHIHDLMNHNPVFCHMLEDPRLQQILAPHLGDYWTMYAFTSSSLPPHGINYGSRIHNDCPRFSPNYTFNMGIIWALDEFTAENGATFILPGSHHVDQTPGEHTFNNNCVQLIAPKGALVVFNAKTFHRAGENNSDLWRHSLTLNACRSYMKQRMDWVRVLKKEYTDNINPQARRIIGFDTQLPTSIEDLFRPDDKRLYKPNQG